MIEHQQRIWLDFGRRPQRPHPRQPLLGLVGRRHGAAVLAGEMEIDGERFMQHQPLVVDARHMAVRIDLQESRRPRMQRRVGRLRIFKPVMLDHRHQLERHAKFLQQPDIPRGARFIDAVEGEHCEGAFREIDLGGRE
jgi:hypothetical protein